MKVVCVTGHSGSGKSTFSKILSDKNRNSIVIDIDALAHRALTEQPVINEIRRIFGEIVFVNDKVDRKKLGEIVFVDKEKKRTLYQLTWIEMKRYIDQILRQNYDLVILDWFLIPDKHYWVVCDARILVKSDDEIRKSRILTRDNIQEEYYRKREKNKYDYSKIKFDYVVNNNTSEEDFINEVNYIYNELFYNSK